MKLLMGGSPCTNWSIAQSPDKREVTPEGIGWKLFRNYVIALEKYKPDYFLYENNYSMAPAIRTAICAEFLRVYIKQGYQFVEHIVRDKKPKPAYEKWYLVHGVTDERMELTCILINSALVSAQNRKRYYWTNIPGVELPQDRGLMVRDILNEGAVTWREKACTLRASAGNKQGVSNVLRHIESGGQFGYMGVAEPVGTIADGKAYALKAQYSNTSIANMLTNGKYNASGIAEPVCVAQRGRYTDTGNRSKKSDGEIMQYYEAREDSKTNALTTVDKDNRVAEPIRVGNLDSTAQAHRIYNIDGKSVTLKGNAGGQGGKTGLYAMPVEFENGIPTKAVSYSDGKSYPVYEVKDGLITIKEKPYPIKLMDGFYIIHKLTVPECRRLQTIPDWYKMPCSDTQNYRMLGNGWTVEVVSHLLSFIPGIESEPIELLSMYDGMGCAHIALDMLSANVIKYYTSEIDKWCIETVSANYPGAVQLGDAFGVHTPAWDYIFSKIKSEAV